MYYWLKQPYGYGVYVVCDYSDEVYHVCNGLPSLMKPKKHSFLKFNPYLELVDITDITTCIENEVTWTFGVIDSNVLVRLL